MLTCRRSCLKRILGEIVFMDYGVEWKEGRGTSKCMYTLPRKPDMMWTTTKEADYNTVEILPELIFGEIYEKLSITRPCSRLVNIARQRVKFTKRRKKKSGRNKQSDEDILVRYASSSKWYGDSGTLRDSQSTMITCTGRVSCCSKNRLRRTPFVFTKAPNTKTRCLRMRIRFHAF